MKLLSIGELIGVGKLLDPKKLPDLSWVNSGLIGIGLIGVEFAGILK